MLLVSQLTFHSVYKMPAIHQLMLTHNPDAMPLPSFIALGRPLRRLEISLLTYFLTLALQVGTIYPLSPYLVFSPLHKNCLEFLGTLPYFSCKFTGYRTLKRNFPISLTVPQFLWETNGTPWLIQMVRNWLEA